MINVTWAKIQGYRRHLNVRNTLIRQTLGLAISTEGAKDQLFVLRNNSYRKGSY